MVLIGQLTSEQDPVQLWLRDEYNTSPEYPDAQVQFGPIPLFGGHVDSLHPVVDVQDLFEVCQSTVPK